MIGFYIFNSYRRSKNTLLHWLFKWIFSPIWNLFRNGHLLYHYLQPKLILTFILTYSAYKGSWFLGDLKTLSHTKTQAGHSRLTTGVFFFGFFSYDSHTGHLTHEPISLIFIIIIFMSRVWKFKNYYMKNKPKDDVTMTVLSGLISKRAIKTH